ncbi:MAG: YggS family pyridoxal phosphate-dependent enzyme [Pseudomonadota bacterium]
MSLPSPIEQGLAAVRANVARACAEAGRDPAEVTLVAVSKLKPPADIRTALAAGQVHFGENYAQHLRDKAMELGVGPAVEGAPPLPVWHYIGPLQRNKVKYVVGTAALIHAVDSEKLGLAIAERAGDRPAGVLVQVNIGREDTKHGVLPEHALELCATLAGMPGLAVRGLMCIPPPGADDATRDLFRAMADLAAEGRARGLPLDELSMGMSQDYPLAITCGATLVRVGTAIFGAR